MSCEGLIENRIKPFGEGFNGNRCFHAQDIYVLWIENKADQENFFRKEF